MFLDIYYILDISIWFLLKHIVIMGLNIVGCSHIFLRFYLMTYCRGS